MDTDFLPARPVPAPALYTLEQTAEALQVSTKTLRRWIAAGDIVAHRFGRQLRISEADLSAFIRLHRQG